MSVTTGEEKVRKHIRGAPSWLISASRKQHRNPCVRFALMAGAEVMCWLSFALAGVSVFTLFTFFAVLLLGPYFAFTLLLYRLTPWSKSSENQGIGFLFFVGSFFLFHTGYRLFVKYPQLRNMDNFSKIESIPVGFQIGAYYAFLAFCSLLVSLVTFDFLVASYWALSVVFSAVLLFYQMVSVVPWYFLALFLLSINVVRLVLRVLLRHSSSSSAAGAALDFHQFSPNLLLRSSLPV